jgi:hypothetical protein
MLADYVDSADCDDQPAQRSQPQGEGTKPNRPPFRKETAAGFDNRNVISKNVIPSERHSERSEESRVLTQE